MTNVKKYTDEQLLKRVTELPGFKGFTGIIDIWVRSNEDAFNKFDDKVYTFDCTGDKPKFIMVCEGTSHAGLNGLKYYNRYGLEGCAVLKSDEIVYNSHVYGLHRGQYPAYRQAKSFPYYRDRDKNKRVDERGNIRHGIIGANCHRAGIHSINIGGWSIGCLVRNIRAEYDEWLAFMDKRPLTVCILKEF